MGPTEYLPFVLEFGLAWSCAGNYSWYEIRTATAMPRLEIRISQLRWWCWTIFHVFISCLLSHLWRSVCPLVSLLIEWVDSFFKFFVLVVYFRYYSLVRYIANISSILYTITSLKCFLYCSETFEFHEIPVAYSWHCSLSDWGPLYGVIDTEKSSWDWAFFLLASFYERAKCCWDFQGRKVVSGSLDVAILTF